MVQVSQKDKGSLVQRLFFGFALISGLSFMGFCLGAWLSGRFLVDRSEGLAGAAEVLMYGLLTAFVHLCAGVVLTLKLEGRGLRLAGIAAFGCGLLVFALFYSLAAAR